MTGRHIAVLTGKRGGYGAMKPMLRAIDDDPSLTLSLIVTDQHLNPEFGATIDEVKKDFDIAAMVDMKQSGDSPAARAEALGACLTKMTGALAEIHPDMLVVFGDRGEVLATTIAALHLRIPIAHLEGGDISGNIDDTMRHAITKLAHLHLPATEDSARRIRALGEEEWRIKVVGDSHVDAIVAGDFPDGKTVRGKFQIPPDEHPIIVLLHPETTNQRDGHADAKLVLAEVLARRRRTIVVYPCSDHGYQGIVQAIGEISGESGVSTHKNIEAPDFRGLMAIASVLVGNSSAGLTETPYFPLAAVNIGDRQKGRNHAENVIHCEFDGGRIKAALDQALGDADFADTVSHCGKPFGDGQSYRRIVDFLKQVELTPRLLDKRMSY